MGCVVNISVEFYKVKIASYVYYSLCNVPIAIYRPMENNLLGSCDWRFEEYHSPLSFVLYSSCVELMALPQKGQLAGKGLIDAFLTRYVSCMRV